MEDKKKKIIKFSLKLGVGVALLTWLIFKIDWIEVLGHLKQISILEIAAYYVVLILGMAISSYKWKILANFKDIRLPFFDFFKLYLAGTFVNNFMPSFIGGDAFKAYQIGKPQKKYKEAASTVVVDRITGLVGAMMLAFIFFLINRRSIFENDILVSINIAIAGFLVAFGIFLFMRRMPLWKNVSKFLPAKVLDFIQTLNSFAEKGILSRAIFHSILFGFVGLAVSNYVLFLALGADVGILDYLSVIFIISIVSSIPVSVNNIGIKEWAYVTFFGFFGVSASLVVTVALLSRILQMILSFIALPVYLGNRKK